MDYKLISKIIKEQRETFSISQEDIAKSAKTTIKNIIKLESGNFGNIRLNTFLRVLSVLWLEIKIVDENEEL